MTAEIIPIRWSDMVMRFKCSCGADRGICVDCMKEYISELENRNKTLSDVIIDYSHGLICEKCGGMLFSNKMKEEADELYRLMSE